MLLHRTRHARAPSRLARGTRLAGLAALLALAACGGGGDEPESAVRQAVPLREAVARQAPVVQPDLVVQVKAPYTIEAVAATHRLTVVDRFGSRLIYRVRPAAGVSALRALDALRGDTRVKFAESNAEGQAPEGRHVSVWIIGGDDRSYGTQWAPQAMRLPAAQTIARGDGVRVAVLDTGVDTTHPMLAPRLARDAAGGLMGRDFVDDDADPAEVGSRADIGYGHGTHVAGLVALAAPGAQLMPLRVLDRHGRGNGWVLAEAIAWALDPDGDPNTDDGAHIINLSFGGTQPTQLLRWVTELATCELDDDDSDTDHPGYDADRTRCRNGYAATVVSAAGNAGDDRQVLYPAAEDVKGNLAVTASDASLRLPAFANRGGWIQYAAPGDRIVSTVPGGGYGTWSGTSMAAPLAAGTAALVLSSRPEGGDPLRPYPRQWTPEYVTKRLTDHAGKLCGTGILQVDALGALIREKPADPACP